MREPLRALILLKRYHKKGEIVMTLPRPNFDEGFKPESPLDDTLFIGNFHKTLPHNEFGEVVADAYRKFERICIEIEAGAPVNFEEVPKGTGTFAPGINKALESTAKFTSPLAGAATEEHGPDPKDLEMPPAPGIRSKSTAAEMVELYWMALLRDKALANFEEDVDVQAAVNDVKNAFTVALSSGEPFGRLQLGLDLPQKNGSLDLQLNSLFRSGLHDEEHGPLISQFFIRDIRYGVQNIRQRQKPYLREKNFLINHESWLHAQNTGKDKFGRDYSNCNNYADQLAGREVYYHSKSRYISTMRDLARFVNRDALHQAYFNTALFLDSIGAPLDDGNPYKGGRYSREGGFATLGGPDLLTLVSEVASRALKVVWRQKWLVHRRARPEVYGGLLQMQFNGLNCTKRSYGLPDLAAKSAAVSRLLSTDKKANPAATGTYFLPMAFSAGSPSHPAYGAGHATVAGACVTVLKAWFDEDAKLGAVIKKAREDSKDPGEIQYLLKPGTHKGGEDFDDPTEYDMNKASEEAEAMKMTVGGELNKIASNVAMGRSMGGVHWRSDNTRSLRLGERIAIEILRKRTMEYAERPVSFTFRAFDRHMVHITQGQVVEF
ncbi:MAG TPA: vanadium-dependent haloperoxidase [Candidatus Competibacter sp.]|nr:vanadium-dependent haloperoxidase [Candidatus Competibacter sp.]